MISMAITVDLLVKQLIQIVPKISMSGNFVSNVFLVLEKLWQSLRDRIKSPTQHE